MADDSEVVGYFYGEEDKGLLDPAWERQQKKVRWFIKIYVVEVIENSSTSVFPR